ncbi:mas-related G-protein coupled receptor member A6-like [Notamacropus eugenii]|uniref:mas-related G-protein coupled receptor member A6-like n=1 Tax=Notamacropus eugenii TaxID=9315 RepID=UPI003B66B12F
MALPPSPMQGGYVHDNTTERSANESSAPGVLGELKLSDWMWILTMLIALIGLVGNSIVLWLLGFRIKRNPFSVYILNLAGADALFLCFSFLVSIPEFVRYLCNSFMHKLLQYVAYTFYTLSLSLLAVISTERCLSVLFPIWYRCHRPKHTSVVMCAVLCTLASLFCVVGFLNCIYGPNHFCTNFFIIEFMWFIALTCGLCMSSLTLLLRVQCSSQSQQAPRLYLVILLTVLVFLLCGLPMEIGEFASRFNIVSMPQWLHQLLACVNSSANPFIYFFLGRQMHKKREPLRVVLQSVLGGKQDLVDGKRDIAHIDTPEPSF